MKRGSPLFNVLHGLLHIAGHGRAMTSDELAVCLDTNPVVVRRLMAGLREAGLVVSTKGHGGGWSLARPLEAISLGQVHAALGEPGPLPSPAGDEAPPGCLIAAAVDAALEETYREVRALLAARLDQISLADLAGDFLNHTHKETHP